MQATFLPSWFVSLNVQPQGYRQAFLAKVTMLSGNNDSIFRDLIDIFGQANQKLVESLFPTHDLRSKFQEVCSWHHTKFCRIVDLSLKDLLENRHLNLTGLNQIYSLSAVSSETIEERIMRDISTHLLTHPMPIQEARRLHCYSLPRIKAHMDAHQAEFEESVQFIFQSSVVHLILHREQALFKYAVLRGHNRLITWGHLFVLWAVRSTKGAMVREEIQAHFRFDKLLCNQLSLNASNTIELTFHEFVIQQTLEILFRHHNTFLPAGIMEEELIEIFSRSIRAQQDAIYFIDYLHQLSAQENSFSFQQALEVLNRLVPHTEPIYHFLRVSLHFLYCTKRFVVEKAEEPFLFAAIRGLSQENLYSYKRHFYEKFNREPLQINAFLKFARQHNFPLEEIGNIALKFSLSLPLPECRDEQPPSINSLAHIEILDNIERHFGLHLPLAVLADFLLFQTASSKIFPLVEAMIRMRALIIEKYLDTLALPSDFFQSLEEHVIELLDCFAFCQFNKENFPLFIVLRSQCYVKNISQIAVLLQLVSYPRPIMSHLIPQTIQNKTLLFKEDGSQLINDLELLMPDFPSGPAKLFQWFFLPETRQLRLSVSLLNSIQYPQRSCAFQVLLKMPFEQQEQISTFFTILTAFIDSFGVERPSEKEEEKMKEAGTLFKPLPEKFLQMQGKPEYMFDAMLSYFPLLQKLWETHQSVFTSHSSMVKAELYTFIKTCRSYYKRAFFTILSDPGRASVFPFLEKDKDQFQVCLLNQDFMQKEFPFDHASFFQKMYHQIKEPHEAVQVSAPAASSDSASAFYQGFSKELRFMMDFPIKKANAPLTFIHQIKHREATQEDIIHMTIEMKLQDKTESMTVAYPSFLDEYNFHNLMLWQMHLFQQQYL